MLKNNIKLLNIKYRSVQKLNLSRALNLSLSLNNFPIFFIVLMISLSVVLTPCPFIFLPIKIYLHTVRPHAHAFYRIRLSQVFLQKAVRNICRKFTGEHPCRSVISIMLSNIINITLQHGCPPVSLLHVFRIAF